jgi:hypothetical protein
VRSKDNPKNELNDVSDAFDALITNLVEPTLFMPLSGHAQPKMPLADDFRTDVCYTAAMDAALMRNAPALRIIFTGLAKIAFEESRSGGGVTPLPKTGSAQQVKREGAKWILVPGHVSITLWRKFTDNIGLLGLDNREQTYCFVYAAAPATVPTPSARATRRTCRTTRFCPNHLPPFGPPEPRRQVGDHGCHRRLLHSRRRQGAPPSFRGLS